MINLVTFKRVLHAVAMVYIIVGLFYFYRESDYNYFFYSKDLSYYAWDKGKDVLLILCMLFPLFEVRKEWAVICGFFLIRLGWEIAAVNDYATASRPSIIFILFLSATLCLIIILLMKIKSRPK